MKVKDLKPGSLFLYHERICMLFRELDMLSTADKFLAVVVWEFKEDYPWLSPLDNCGVLILVDKEKDVKYFKRAGANEDTAYLRLIAFKCSSCNEGSERRWKNG